MPSQVTRITAGAPVDVEIAGLSNHVLAYRLWFRTAAAADWALLGEGHTGDGAADRFALDVPAGRAAQLYYWVGVGNPQLPGSTYRGRITLGQGGRPLDGGAIDLAGRTDDAGVATQEDWCDVL